MGDFSNHDGKRARPLEDHSENPMVSMLSHFFVMKLCLLISKTKFFRKLAHKIVVRQHKEIRTQRKWQLILQHTLKMLSGIQLIEQICNIRRCHFFLIKEKIKLNKQAVKS